MQPGGFPGVESLVSAWPAWGMDALVVLVIKCIIPQDNLLGRVANNLMCFGPSMRGGLACIQQARRPSAHSRGQRGSAGLSAPAFTGQRCMRPSHYPVQHAA